MHEYVHASLRGKRDSSDDPNPLRSRLSSFRGTKATKIGMDSGRGRRGSAIATPAAPVGTTGGNDGRRGLRKNGFIIVLLFESAEGKKEIDATKSTGGPI